MHIFPRYIDNLSNTEIEFNSNGKVTGIQDKYFYQLLYDFGEGLNFDVVFISANNRHESQDIFHYKISSDTLRLFKVDGDNYEYTIGEKKYELIKK